MIKARESDFQKNDLVTHFTWMPRSFLRQLILFYIIPR